MLIIMGCCLNTLSLVPTAQKAETSQVYSDPSFQISSSSPSISNINDPITIIDNLSMNALGLSLWKGNLSEFITLCEQKGAKITLMEELFQKQGKSGLEVIIEKGYQEFFFYYLPVFLLNSQFSNVLEHPILHKAIKLRENSIVKFVHSYFSCVKAPPAFNFEYIDHRTGENSALVACRSLDLDMIQFINEVCGADFSVINKKKQNALQISVAAMEEKGYSSEVFEYLITNCGIDIVYNYKLIISSLGDIEILGRYLEELERWGIRNFGEIIEKNEGKADWGDEEGLGATAISSISVLSVQESSASLWASFEEFEFLDK